jgi:flagellar hook-associated protein 3 FlgL
MRVTEKMNQSQLLNNLQKTRSELSELQNQATTQKRINKPSDDPTGVGMAMQNRTNIKNLQQYDRNIMFAKTFLENSELALTQVGDALVRAKELAVQGASDTNAGLPRQTIATEVHQLYNTLVEAANRRYGERYIFGGFNTLQAPFDHDGNYLGDNGQIQIQNQQGQFMSMNLTGDQVFHGENLSYRESINRDSTVPKTAEELQDFKLKQIEAEYEKEQLEEENLIELRSPASAERVQRLDLDSKPSGVNLFNLLIALETSLITNDKAGVQETLEPLDKALNQINLARAEIGGRLNQMDATSEGIQKNIIDTKVQTSTIEDADIFKTMTDLNTADSTLKATLETSSRISNQSLLDFLR